MRERRFIFTTISTMNTLVGRISLEDISYTVFYLIGWRVAICFYLSRVKSVGSIESHLTCIQVWLTGYDLPDLA